MIYHHLASRLTDKGKLKLDALLGDPVAVAKQKAEAQAAFASFAGGAP